MKKKLIVYAVVVMMLAAGVLAGCGGSGSSSGSAGSASGDTSGLADWDGAELTVVTNYGPTHRGLEIINHWTEAVTAATDGKLTFVLYPGEELVKNAEMYGALKEGVADVLCQDPSYNPESFPLIKAFALPGIQMDNSKVCTYAANDYWNYAIEQGWAETTGIKFLYTIGLAPAGFESNVKIEKAADFKGLSIRANGYAIEPIRALGASPEGIPAPEVYEALMKGTVQASLMPYDALANWKLAEVSKYIITAPVVSNTNHYVIMNEKTWNSLPKEVQDIINEINLETIDFAAPLFDDMAAGGIAYAEEQKAEIYELDAAVLTEMSTMMNSVVTDYLAEMTKAGLDGQLALDKVKELADKYNAQYGGAN